MTRTILDRKSCESDSGSPRVALITSRQKDPTYKLCLLVHKSLLRHTPEYISDLLTLAAKITCRSTLCTSLSGNLVVPMTCQHIGDRAFSVAALRACSRLPIDLNLLHVTGLMQDQLKTFFFQSAESAYRHREMN